MSKFQSLFRKEKLGIFQNPKAYIEGRARNFSKSQSLYKGVRARNFSKSQNLYRKERNMKEYVENMKKYEGSMKEYMENMKEI